MAQPKPYLPHKEVPDGGRGILLAPQKSQLPTGSPTPINVPVPVPIGSPAPVAPVKDIKLSIIVHHEKS